MPQCYPANPKAVEFVTQLTLIMGICQAWIDHMMMTESLPADMRPLLPGHRHAHRPGRGLHLHGQQHRIPTTLPAPAARLNSTSHAPLHGPAVPLGRQPPWPPRNHGTLESRTTTAQHRHPCTCQSKLSTACAAAEGGAPPHRRRLQVPAHPARHHRQGFQPAQQSAESIRRPHLSPNRPHAIRRHLQQAL